MWFQGCGAPSLTKCLSLQFWWLRIWKCNGKWFLVCFKGLGGPVRGWGWNAILPGTFWFESVVYQFGCSLLREKQRGFPVSCTSLLLPRLLIFLGHKDSFPALALGCPLSPSKSTKRSVSFPVILPFPSLLFPLHPIQPETVKLEDLRRSETNASIFFSP